MSLFKRASSRLAPKKAKEKTEKNIKTIQHLLSNDNMEMTKALFNGSSGNFGSNCSEFDKDKGGSLDKVEFKRFAEVWYAALVEKGTKLPKDKAEFCAK
jgi:hypothetical protein